MTVVDLELVILEDLGESIKCENKRCSATAEYACICRKCRRTLLVCVAHLEDLKSFAVLADWFRQGLLCRACGNKFKRFEDGIEVMPL